ncbi:MAG: B12-binding domain-containing radical SAM protein [Magnetococcales bacterium]|nr:B12-binding domain-containing radical SAM protein [Magnetococcales bacterium]
MKVVCLAIHSETKQNPGMPTWNYSLPHAFLQAYMTTSSFYSEFEFCNLNFREFDDPKDMANEIANLKPDIVAVSCYVWNMRAVEQVVPMVKEKLPYVISILGGAELNHNSQFLLKDAAADFLVIGEGEKTFLELMEHLLKGDGSDPSNISGLIFKNQANEIEKTPPRQRFTDLNKIPSPYLLGLVDPKHIQDGLVGLETQRGCILNCAFCDYQKGFKNVRFVDVDRVLKEVEWIISHNPKQLYLMDPTFNSNRKRAKAILSAIIKGKNPEKPIAVNAEMIPDMLDEELIHLAKEAGFNYLEVGVQTLNEVAVEKMDRYRNEKKLFKNINIALQYNLPVVPQIVFGLPGDNFDSFLATFDRIYALPTANIQVFHLLLLPGTRYRDEAELYGIKFDASPPYHIIQSNDFPVDKIVVLKLIALIVLITQPMKQLLTQISIDTRHRLHEMFLGFIQQCNAKELAFSLPLNKQEEKVIAMNAVGLFYKYVCLAVLSSIRDEEDRFNKEQSLKKAMKLSQILLM